MTTLLHRPIPPSTRQDRKYEIGTIKKTVGRRMDDGTYQDVEITIPAEIYGPFAIRWQPADRPGLLVVHHLSGVQFALCKGRNLQETREYAELVIDHLESFGMERWQYTDPTTPEARAVQAEFLPRFYQLRAAGICV